MPPLILPPPNIKPWKPMIPHAPAPPTPDPNPDLKRYEEAKAAWKDSTPAYRHKSPRPETWIPRPIVDTNYNLPTAVEREARRLEYADILESIKDRIPPEYYQHFRERFARPVNFDVEGPDETGYIDGYKSGMFTHPRFMEKDHSKYHALPRKMFPEDEKLYKLQQTEHVKDSLDILEDNGMDYEERMWVAKHKAEEKRREDESYMREEVFRTTHWVDWDSDDDEMIGVGKGPSDVKSPTASDKAQLMPIEPEIAQPERQSAIKEAKKEVKLSQIARETVPTDTKTGLGAKVVNVPSALRWGRH